jgi:hypothetical protein
MHVSIYSIVVDLPKSPRIENFTRILNQYFQNVHTNGKFLLRIEVPSAFKEAEDVYDKFIQFKSLCGHYGSLQLILVLGADLAPWEHFNKRWTGEKIFAIQLDVTTFVDN